MFPYLSQRTLTPLPPLSWPDRKGASERFSKRAGPALISKTCGPLAKRRQIHAERQMISHKSGRSERWRKADGSAGKAKRGGKPPHQSAAKARNRRNCHDKTEVRSDFCPLAAILPNPAKQPQAADLATGRSFPGSRACGLRSPASVQVPRLQVCLPVLRALSTDAGAFPRVTIRRRMDPRRFRHRRRQAWFPATVRA